MKKYMISQVLLMAVMAVFTISFTSCGGDDASDGIQTPPVVPGNNGELGVGKVVEWVDLYMNWDASLDQVKATVVGQGWKLVSEANKIQTYTSTSHPNVVLNYGAAFTTTLGTAQAIYSNSSEDFYRDCIDKIQTKYSAQVNQNGNTTTATAANINGWKVSINIFYTPSTKITTVQFNATGKVSSGDNVTGEGEIAGGGEISQSDWVTPYISWTAAMSDVKAELLTQGWILTGEGTHYLQLKRDGHPNVEMEYRETEYGLRTLHIFYHNSTLEYAKWAKDKLMAEYGLEIYDNEKNLSYNSYMVLFKSKDINGKSCYVSVSYNGISKELTIDFD